MSVRTAAASAAGARDRASAVLTAMKRSADGFQRMAGSGAWRVRQAIIEIAAAKGCRAYGREEEEKQ